MSHLVIFESSEGSTVEQHCEDLDSAIRYVEEIRNEQGVERARIFALHEVPFTFKPYYMVTIDDDAATTASSPAPSGADALGASEPEPEPEPQVEPQGEAEAAVVTPAVETPEATTPVAAEVHEPELNPFAPEPADASNEPAEHRRGLFGR